MGPFGVGGTDQPLIMPTLFTNGNVYYYPDLAFGLPQDNMVFSDVDWIPGMSSGTLQPFVVSEWTAEGMVVNPETGVVENRVTAEATGVHVQPIDNQNATITGIDFGTTIYS